AMFLYLLAFISMNDDQIDIDFVFFTATVSLIWAMVLMVGFGVLGGVLLSQLYRRRRGDKPRQSPDSLP
ncbi:MAG: LapA family protein, partial [Gaiellaceae bacterium]